MDNKELLNFMLVRLIISDTCIDVKSCEESLRGLETMREMLSRFKLSEEDLEFYNKKIDDGIDIVRQDLEDFRKNEKVE